MNFDLDTSGAFISSSRIYLNNASSSLIPLKSIKAMTDFIIRYNESGPDSIDFGIELADRYNQLRQTISKLIRCRPEEVILTQSTTDGINMVAGGLSLPKNSNIVIRGTTHEHHSNYYPWLRLAKSVELRSVSNDTNGFFEVAEFEKLLDDNTKIVALSHALYNTGAIMPVEEIGKILEEKNIPYFLDAAQTVGCIGDYDFSRTKCNFMAFNGYKWLCGPMGIGIFYCKKDSSNLLEPAQIGGESAMIYDNEKIAYKDIPDKFQAGFRNYSAIVGLETSVSYLLHLGLDNIRKKIISLANLFRDEIAKIPNVTLYGPEDQEKRTSIVSFSIGKKSPQDMVEQLEKLGIVLAVREISDTKIVRAAPHFFNTETDILRTIDAIKRL
ncbi:MAG: aminotransferase class V-fold PLP-dependent enzyme [Candidatus Nitrosotenuis sp.]|nr:MAG: aminotransferase class V-fold PLP-dependent enzyme [Candidatus Nitrosotenuis sp.]